MVETLRRSAVETDGGSPASKTLMLPQAAPAPVAAWFEEHRSFLWALSYRVTGSAADADDVVQDTFVRACTHARSTLDDPRGWLMRVAINLGRDVLRRRKRRTYVGPWLPAPIETSGTDAPPSYEPAVDGATIEGRYGLLESASLAFLQALEALSPTHRAVLLLRDVFDYSVAEVAAALTLSIGNVRIIHHRARRSMAKYEQDRAVPTPAARARTERTLQRFVTLLRERDVKGIEELLVADVRAVTDAGGEFTASLRDVTGRRRVTNFFVGLATSRGGTVDVAIRTINEFPTAVLTFAHTQDRRPPRLVLSVDVNCSGAIAQIRVIANSRKLTGIQHSRTRTAMSEGDRVRY